MKFSRKIILNLLFIVTLLTGQKSLASFEIAAGTNSMIGGRIIPALELSLSVGDNLFSWVGAGVRNSYYYQSSHQISYFKTWNAGNLWGGDMIAGFGGAAAYSIRSFQDSGSTTEEKKSDYILGPALRMSWTYGFVFINLSSTFGIRDLYQHIAGLTFQDVETLTLGVRF